MKILVSYHSLGKMSFGLDSKFWAKLWFQEENTWKTPTRDLEPGSGYIAPLAGRFS